MLVFGSPLNVLDLFRDLAKFPDLVQQEKGVRTLCNLIVITCYRNVVTLHMIFVS